MLKVLVIPVLVLVAGVLAALLYGSHRWNTGTQQLRAQLEAARTPIQPRTVSLRELDGLPAPVQRYFRAVLQEGQPMVAGARMLHAGMFNMGEAADLWKPFTSDQKIVTQRPGFDWDARIHMLPGVTVHVHDAYVAGDSLLHASLFGLLSLVDLHGNDEVAEGELMRFFAEAAWYPTALLPSQGVRWQAVDDRSARGTLADGRVRVTLLFTFNEQGLIDTVHAATRGRAVDGQIVPTPWQGRFWNYDTRAGRRVPLDGEVAWLLPEGRKPYWRAHITRLDVEPAH